MTGDKARGQTFKLSWTIINVICVSLRVTPDMVDDNTASDFSTLNSWCLCCVLGSVHQGSQGF